MKLLPTVGIGEIRFGMNPKEVATVFGSDTIWEQWMGGNLNDSLCYPGIIFYFDEHDTYGPLENGKLVQIEANASFPGTLFEAPLSALTRNDVLLHLRSRNLVAKEYPNGSLESPDLRVHWWFNEDGSLNIVRFDNVPALATKTNKRRPTQTDVSEFLCSRQVALTRVTDEAISVQHSELIHRQLPLTR